MPLSQDFYNYARMSKRMRFDIGRKEAVEKLGQTPPFAVEVVEPVPAIEAYKNNRMVNAFMPGSPNGPAMSNDNTLDFPASGKAAYELPCTATFTCDDMTHGTKGTSTLSYTELAPKYLGASAVLTVKMWKVDSKLATSDVAVSVAPVRPVTMQAIWDGSLVGTIGITIPSTEAGMIKVFTLFASALEASIEVSVAVNGVEIMKSTDRVTVA